MCRLLLQLLKMSDRNVAVLGLIMSIVSCTLLGDWQSIAHDECVDFSPFHNPHLMARNYSKNPGTPEVMYAVSHNLGERELHPSVLNCRPDVSHKYMTCTVEQVLTNKQNFKTFSNYNCSLTSEDLLYQCIETSVKNINVAVDPEYAGTQTLKLLNNTVYYKMMVQCEDTVVNGQHCHWIPNSVITHRYCHDCQPICRNPRYSLNFIQFSFGAAILMLSIPVAWIPVASLVSQRIKGEMQVLFLVKCS